VGMQSDDRVLRRHRKRVDSDLGEGGHRCDSSTPLVGFKDETTDETLERLPNEEELMALRMARDILHEESLGFACEVRGECGSSDD
jgi:hypothetical protein